MGFGNGTYGIIIFNEQLQESRASLGDAWPILEWI
jgi:hypothetical protein